MLWFRLPSNLCLKADWKDRYVIIEYCCLYAQLEREPTEKELSKQLTPKQRERLAEWLPTLRENLAKDLASAQSNRKSRILNYEKSAGLRGKCMPYTTADTTEIVPWEKEKKRKELYTPQTPLVEFTPPSMQEIIDFANAQNSSAGCGGFSCTPKDAIRFWLVCSHNDWHDHDGFPIRNWQLALRNHRFAKLVLDPDDFADKWNKLSKSRKSLGIPTINPGDVTETALASCNKALVDVVCGLVVNTDTRDETLAWLAERKFNLWAWAFQQVLNRIDKSEYLRGKTREAFQFGLQFFLATKNFKSLISPNSSYLLDNNSGRYLP